jgi:nucleoid-associated protein YgaU
LSNSKITTRVLGAGAAVALSAGIGLATATPAHADVWDQVAQCESSGNWGTSTGNGFYGGLQFTQSTWNAYGGSGNPANASASEQKAVARRVLAGQGPGAWPVCGPRAGLSRSNGGSASSYSSSNNYHSSRSTRSYHSNSGSSSNSGYSHHSGYSNNSSSYTPRHSSGSYSDPAPSYQLPRHAYHGTGNYVTVKSGDTLSAIAAAHRVNGGWMALWSINHNHISNPDVIQVGQSIEL